MYWIPSQLKKATSKNRLLAELKKLSVIKGKREKDALFEFKKFQSSLNAFSAFSSNSSGSSLKNCFSRGQSFSWFISRRCSI